jgi:glyoxylase-like metal-dependent hydrolase (beta-lactamase superfamily II)/rhodanese-related sulfurtransferase
MIFHQFFIDGLGCASYLLGSDQQGVAVVVDPDRDIKQYLDFAASHALKITHIIETHLHADHVSGNTALARHCGAPIYIHKAALAGFPHQILQGGDQIELGELCLEVLHTPGHTPESITLLVTEPAVSDQPILALTGDTLFAGDVGRPDLTGAKAMRELAWQMHRSLFSVFAGLEDGLAVYPGHGAGSLCGKSLRPERSTTLGYERQHNLAFEPQDVDSFITFATQKLPKQPGNHQAIKALNRHGPTLLDESILKPLSIKAAIPIFQRGAALLDTRPKKEYNARHIPGSVHMPLDEQLSNALSQVLPPETPLVLLPGKDQPVREIFFALVRVGYENLPGYLTESLEKWEALGLPVSSGDIQDITPLQLFDLLKDSQVLLLDVRENWEYLRHRVPGGLLIPMGQLPRRLSELDPDRPTAVICEHGSRSKSAAAFLGQHKFQVIYNVIGGTQNWISAGLPVEQG